jgi:aspartyl-tRNA(Asn)/glutamyl-tRNA(Gln) amidotransferase subunit A
MAGICGISVPCGFAEQGGKRLPVGLQILGQELDESTILQTSYAYEQSTEWHKAKPTIGA